VLKASVIITTYQRSGFLIRALHSVLNQEYDNFEIIIVDDNGRNSDFQRSNEKLLQEYISDNRIKYVALENNSGACNARNQGALNAQGEYLFFLDDDDEFLPKKLAVQVDFLDKNSLYAAHLSSMIRINYNGAQIISIENMPRGSDFVSFAMDGNFFTPMMAIRKNIFLELGGFDEIDRFQDQYFMNKLLAEGYRVKMDSIPLHIMYEHNEKRITDISLAKSLESLDKLLNFKCIYKEKFTPAKWKEVEVKHLKMKAFVFSLSEKYIHHLKASLLYMELFVKQPSKKILYMVFRSFIPVYMGDFSGINKQLKKPL